MIRYLVLLALLLGPSPLWAQDPAEDAAMQASVEELRASVGRWQVTTEFLNEDGSVAKSVAGTYEFSWIVPDRVVAGKSEIPELQQAAGILFYVNKAKEHIEMVSVGGDGALWIMTGPLGGDHRLSQEYKTATGTGQLRFTRYNVTEQTFESKMEYTEDGGKTWKPGNHQTFRRM